MEMIRSSAILIVSTRAFTGQRPDQTAAPLKERLTGAGFSVQAAEIVPDDSEKIKSAIRKFIEAGIKLILISGGTGLSPDDLTPEATLDVIEKRIPGIEEEMRRASLSTTPYAMLSRGIAGSAGKSLIVNLPGNPSGALQCLEVIKPVLWHALLLLDGQKPHP